MARCLMYRFVNNQIGVRECNLHIDTTTVYWQTIVQAKHVSAETSIECEAHITPRIGACELYTTQVASIHLAVGTLNYSG